MNSIIFPGQGIALKGLIHSLITKYPNIASYISDAEEVFGLDLRLEGESDRPTTAAAQAIIYSTSCAIFDQLELDYKYTAGHSLGEYAAMYAAKAITYKQGLLLLKHRSDAMQKICQQIESGMLACVGTGDVEGLAKTSGCEIANYNSSSQTVLSGLSSNIDKALELASSFNLRGIKLNTAGAYHSSLMKAAADEFEKYVSSCSLDESSDIVIANTTALPLENLSSNLVKHIYSPVLWKQTISYMQAQGIDNFIEIGTTGVLSKMLIRDCIQSSNVF